PLKGKFLETLLFFCRTRFIYFLGFVLLTFLMTPTATVWRMSRTAKRPRGGYSLKSSTHMGFDGIRVAMTASPFLTILGFSSMVLPVRLSIFWWSSENLQAMWAVWQSRTGV